MMTLADTTSPTTSPPRLIRQNPQALAVLRIGDADAWAAKKPLMALGVPLEFALYGRPERQGAAARRIGFVLALQHKWTLRTCFNEQERESISLDGRDQQVKEIHPQLGRYLGPPCVLRNKIVSPRCTEGTHFCGVPVWNTFPNGERRL